ncbi:MAG: MoxR family ATPase [Planctomycetota bacterium]|nr:MoxR family ATPase [Planctomycetota bacterium]
MPATPPPTASDAQLLRLAGERYAGLRTQISKVIVGQDAVVEALLAAIFAQGHVALVGVPGLAKTLLVRTLASALDWSFKRIQFTPDLMPADIIGMEILRDGGAGGVSGAVSGGRAMEFVRGPIFANLVLADEINRTPPKTQSALLEAMQEYTVTSMGRTHTLERPFVVVATQNPIEQEGTYPLPEAQLDRFMFSLRMDYPGREEEERIVAGGALAQPPEMEPVFSREETLAVQALVRRVPASAHVVSYAVALARATRPAAPESPEMVRRYVEWGAGPRAGQHLLLAGQALAVLAGRPHVAAADIRRAAPWVLRHRVLPNYAAAGEGVAADAIVAHVLEQVREPGYTS